MASSASSLPGGSQPETFQPEAIGTPSGVDTMTYAIRTPEVVIVFDDLIMC